LEIICALFASLQHAHEFFKFGLLYCLFFLCGYQVGLIDLSFGKCLNCVKICVDFQSFWFKHLWLSFDSDVVERCPFPEPAF